CKNNIWWSDYWESNIGYIVLHNADEVEPYFERHKEMLRKSNPNPVPKILKWLADGPSIHVLSYYGYLINEFTFYMKK
ncbi:hypothetical protein Lal_00042448, partial [Lupinus albus]